MKVLMTITMCFLLATCGGDSGDERDANEEKVFDPLVKSVDKAKTVEDTVLQQKEDMDEAMKQMEEGMEDPENER
jgi:hypothetical protein